MTNGELAQALALKVLCPGDMTRKVTGCYCGDLLSWVMSRAQSGDAWLTVMGNINAIGVAALADLACIILTEDASIDDDALAKAEQNCICVLTSSLNTYEVASAISNRL